MYEAWVGKLWPLWWLCYPANQPCVSTESKAFLCGIISFAPNLSEATEAAAAAHLNMKVQNVFHLICSFSNACIFIFFTEEKVGNAMVEDIREKRRKKMVQGCLVQIFSQCSPVDFSHGSSQPWNFLVHDCGRGCNAHVALCAHRPTGCLVDWLPDPLLGWLFDHLHYKVLLSVSLDLHLQPFRNGKRL